MWTKETATYLWKEVEKLATASSAEEADCSEYSCIIKPCVQFAPIRLECLMSCSFSHKSWHLSHEAFHHFAVFKHFDYSCEPKDIYACSATICMEVLRVACEIEKSFLSQFGYSENLFWSMRAWRVTNVGFLCWYIAVRKIVWWVQIGFVAGNVENWKSDVMIRVSLGWLIYKEDMWSVCKTKIFFTCHQMTIQKQNLKFMMWGNFRQNIFGLTFSESWISVRLELRVFLKVLFLESFWKWEFSQSYINICNIISNYTTFWIPILFRHFIESWRNSFGTGKFCFQIPGTSWNIQFCFLM